MKYLETKASGGAPQNKALTGPPANKQDDVDATDAAAQLAKEAGIDLSTVKGSGEGGRITKPDVEAAIDAQKATP
jgi:pyruvate/2-oxoglutarate dehydrogenase complex dihydrolipoamide acyltransferase (E2) component